MRLVPAFITICIIALALPTQATTRTYLAPPNQRSIIDGVWQNCTLDGRNVGFRFYTLIVEKSLPFGRTVRTRTLKVQYRETQRDGVFRDLQLRHVSGLDRSETSVTADSANGTAYSFTGKRRTAVGYTVWRGRPFPFTCAR